ncbi:MAG: flagellar biosynthesis protein [Lachnospiraceae bacterium]|nr:flagellar biosynthesis protein [Lachnospiraceae bacterium]
MPDNVQKILGKIKEWWLKFSTKQKTLLISITAVVILALVILGAVMTQPRMVRVITCENTTQSSEVKGLLEGEGIEYIVSSDGLTFEVNAEDEANAAILLGSNEIPTEGYGIDDVFDGSFSTTESDKSKKYQLYLEGKFEDQLATISNIESASVSLSIPEEDGTIISMGQETYASVILQLSGEMTEEQAAGIAKFVATEVGNDSTDNILILDSDGNVLFSGGDTSTAIGTANSQLSVKEKTENMVKSEVKDVVLGTDLYDNVEVGLNLAMDFDTEEYTDHHYYVDEGQTQGYLDSKSTYEAESTGGEAGVPGTDSNDDDTTYVLPDSEVTSSSVTEVQEDFLPSEEITRRTSEGGKVDLENSSISVVATSYVVYDEKALKADGTLDGMTFDEFVAQNSDRIKTTVDEEFYAMVANATGISAENITIVAYDVPFFKYASASGRDWTDYLQIALAVLIFALLGLVVFMSTRKQASQEMEPELSVEGLLETTRDLAQENLEDIGFVEKSETRVLIERFVEENPEAAAALLRNWLNEEWE